MKKGVGINRDQARVLGVNIRESGWKNNIIDTEFPTESYNLFVRLKGKKPFDREKILAKYPAPVSEKEYFDALEIVYRYNKDHHITTPQVV